MRWNLDALTVLGTKIMEFELKGENEKYQDKYSNLAFTYLIENLPFWPCRWICGLGAEQGQSQHQRPIRKISL